MELVINQGETTENDRILLERSTELPTKTTQ
jgi:hypothetical protein